MAKKAARKAKKKASEIPPPDFQAGGQDKSKSLGKPRLGSHNRLLSRFYGPLVLLHVLGQTRGCHTNALSTGDPLLETCRLRRQFLNDLSYVCDYDKGGDTVTSIAIEARPQGFVYWLASNKHPDKKVTDFLSNCLKDLRRISRSSVEEIQPLRHELVTQCIQFSTKRIKKYWSCLRPLLQRCFLLLEVEQGTSPTSTLR